MGEFKNILKSRKRVKQSKEELKTLGKAIEERGKRTVKIPNFSDKKTGKMMIEQKNLSRKVPRMIKVYKKKRNLFVGKTGAKALIAGAAIYGGKTLIDDYERSNEKYAGYPSRVADSLSRLVNFRRNSNEVRSSAQKAGKMIKKELKKKKSDTGELGHLNAKKVKEGRTAKRKRRVEIAGAFAGPGAVLGSGIYLKKEYDQSHPQRLTHYMR